MAFTEDFTAFFNTDEFAVTVLWKGSVSVKAIFDNQFSVAQNMAGTNPVILAPQSSMPGAKRGDAIVINNVNFLINSQPEQDGTGLLSIELEKQ